MSDSRRVAFLTGILFILTFISAIAGLVLYGPVLEDPDYVLGEGADTRILLGAVCEIVLCVANIGTALALFSILKRQNEGLALGYVAARIVESTLIAVGIVSLLSVVTLRQSVAMADADAASFVAAARSLVALHDWTFLLGPGFVVGIGNGMILGYLMYRSGLVPRTMAMFGLVGGPLLCISSLAVLFGLYEQVSVWAFAATLPEIIWEASLGIWLVVVGFRPSAVLPPAAIVAPASAPG